MPNFGKIEEIWNIIEGYYILYKQAIKSILTLPCIKYFRIHLVKLIEACKYKFILR